MGIGNALKTCFNGLVKGAQKVIKGVSHVVFKTAEVTAEVVGEVLQYTGDKCKQAAKSIREWINEGKTKPEGTKYPPYEVKVKTQPQIDKAEGAIKAQFPEGITQAATNGDPVENKQKVEELCKKYAEILNLEPAPDIELVVPEDPEEIWSLYGSYSFTEHKLRLNMPMVVSGEPELLREIIGTALHEAIHARQSLAIQAWASGESVEKYGYTEDYVKTLAENMVNYISPEENYEAYTKQPLEAEARWAKEQLLNNINL